MLRVGQADHDETLLQAQTPIKPALDPLPIEVDRGAAGVARWLKALQTRASILMVTAHPDDEDGGMLTYESRGKGTRVAIWMPSRLPVR